MMPGVTYLPPASSTVTPEGALRLEPTATILPSVSRIEPRWISGPAAVRMVAFLINTGWLGCRT
jgi:hypothetical protein